LHGEDFTWQDYAACPSFSLSLHGKCNTVAKVVYTSTRYSHYTQRMARGCRGSFGELTKGIWLL